MTCQGRMEQGIRLDADYIARALSGDGRREAREIAHRANFRQLSLFDDFHLDERFRIRTGRSRDRSWNCVFGGKDDDGICMRTGA